MFRNNLPAPSSRLPNCHTPLRNFPEQQISSPIRLPKRCFYCCIFRQIFRGFAIFPVLFTTRFALGGFDKALQLYKFSLLLERFGSD